MNFIEKILDGFNKIISFLGNLFKPLFDLLAAGFNALLDLLEKPLSLLFYFLDGIFYFFNQVFDVVVLVIKIFTAMFQFVGALVLGVFRTIKLWLSVSVTPSTNFPSASKQGLDVVLDIIQPTGLLTVVPMVATAFLWFYFVLKIIGLFGGGITVSPFGKGE